MCYDKLLGIKNACTPHTPINNVFLDDVTGVTLTELAQLFTEDYEDGEALFEAKRKVAWELMGNDIYSMLGSKIKGETIIDGERIGFPISTNPIALPALGTGNWVGTRMNIVNKDSFLKFFISDVNIWSQVDTTVTVRVIDMTTRKQIDSFDVETNNDVYIGKSYSSRRKEVDIAIVYNSVDATYQTNVRRGYCSDCSSNFRCARCNRLTEAVAVNLTLDGNFSATNVKNIAYTYGLSINYNVMCDREAWLCSIGNALQYALAYGTSAQLMEFAIHNSINSRSNTTVSVNIEECKTRYQFYMEAYKSQLETVLNNMRLPKDSECFYCPQNVKYIQFVAP